MKTHKREILIYYNAQSNSDKQTVAHAQGLAPYIKSYAYGKTPSTTTSWQMILNALDMHPKDLLNKAKPYYQANIRGKEFDEESWVNILKNNPDLIKAPIAMREGKAVLCLNPTDIYKL